MDFSQADLALISSIARSFKNLKTSRKFDFPEAFGPIKNALS